MNGKSGKIRITLDDIARRDAAASAHPSSREPGASTEGVMARSRRLIPWIIGLCSAGILVVALLFTQTREYSLSEWKEMQRKKINAELKSSPDVKSFIEEIHPLVKFTGAAVKSLDVRTVDGTDRVGRRGSNISELEYVVTFYWEGPVQKNGYTEILYIWDMQGNQIKTYRYLDSTATINLDNIDWKKVGMLLIPLLL